MVVLRVVGSLLAVVGLLVSAPANAAQYDARLEPGYTQGSWWYTQTYSVDHIQGVSEHVILAIPVQHTVYNASCDCGSAATMEDGRTAQWDVPPAMPTGKVAVRLWTEHSPRGLTYSFCGHCTQWAGNVENGNWSLTVVSTPSFGLTVTASQKADGEPDCSTPGKWGGECTWTFHGSLEHWDLPYVEIRRGDALPAAWPAASGEPTPNPFDSRVTWALVGAIGGVVATLLWRRRLDKSA